MFAYSTFTCPETGLYAYRIKKHGMLVYESCYCYSSGRQARLAALAWIKDHE